MSDGTEHGFLGEEFLTWLWFKMENDGGAFDIDGEEVGVVIHDFIAFAPHEADETEQSLRKGLPTRSAEARAGLRGGRRLRRARLLVARGEDEWMVTLDGPTMGLSGIKIPPDSGDAASAGERSEARIEAFLEIHDVVFAVYAEFLRDRLRPEYLSSTAEQQATWMASA